LQIINLSLSLSRKEIGIGSILDIKEITPKVADIKVWMANWAAG
jgi:hypothetical protein